MQSFAHCGLAPGLLTPVSLIRNKVISRKWSTTSPNPCFCKLLQRREMQVKWRGEIFNQKELPGGGAMGATLGNMEISSQTNHCADCVPEDHRGDLLKSIPCVSV